MRENGGFYGFGGLGMARGVEMGERGWRRNGERVGVGGGNEKIRIITSCNSMYL